VKIIPVLVECEDIRLEQGLANLFGDRLENKYSGFADQGDMVELKIYIRPKK
jgi:hypothetical protein